MASGKKGKGFFALDVDQFFKIQEHGLGLEEAATYLALLKSTDQTNAISRGGVNSVMGYTGLSRSEAKRAIDNLDRVGLVEKLDVERARARTVPRFKLPTHESRSALTPLEAAAVAKIAAGIQPATTRDRNTTFRAQKKGWLEKLSTGWAPVPASQQIAYVPNMFVDMPEGTSPLSRLMQIGEIGPMMLVAELYHKQDLMNERGIPPSLIRSYYRSAFSLTAGASPSGFRIHRMELGRPPDDTGGERTFDRVYSPSKFRSEKSTFWKDLKALEAAHIVEWAIYSANGKPEGDQYAFNRPQRPLGVLRGGKHVRNTPEADAAFASWLMWREQQRISGERGDFSPEEVAKAWCDNGHIIVVENAHVAHVEGVGILRMACRAHTENTTVWFKDRGEERRAALFFLDGVRRAAFQESLVLQSDIGFSSVSSAAISM